MQILKKIPPDCFSCNVVNVIKKVISETREIDGFEVLRAIPQKWFDNELIELLIKKCNGIGNGVPAELVEIVPRHYFDYKFIKLISDEYFNGLISVLAEKILPENMSSEIIEILILSFKYRTSKKHQSDFKELQHNFPKKYLNNEIMKLIIAQEERFNEYNTNRLLDSRMPSYGVYSIPMERPICEITKFLKNKSEINHEKCSFHRLAERLPNSKINKCDDKCLKKLNERFS